MSKPNSWPCSVRSSSFIFKLGVGQSLSDSWYPNLDDLSETGKRKKGGPRKRLGRVAKCLIVLCCSHRVFEAGKNIKKPSLLGSGVWWLESTNDMALVPGRGRWHLMVAAVNGEELTG